jgi:hypothetical protein
MGFKILRKLAVTIEKSYRKNKNCLGFPGIQHIQWFDLKTKTGNILSNISRLMN